MPGSTAPAGVKDDLHTALREGRASLLWKLEGLSEYDVRRPLTPTGTNLLGLVKHLTSVELLYFGLVFGRHFTEPVPWFGEHVAPGTDLWATPEESTPSIVGVYRRACAHADATIEATDLDTTGFVPWFPAEQAHASLHRLMVHMLVELHRRLGHADIVRELVDGAVGQRQDLGPDELEGANDILRLTADPAWWKEHHDHLERVAREAAGSS